MALRHLALEANPLGKNPLAPRLTPVALECSRGLWQLSLL